jgi:regulatory protein
MTGTITALKQQKRNPQRVNVYLDGKFAFGLAKIVAAWLKVGQTLSEKQISRLQGKDEVEAAYQRALKYLSYRPRSTAEVERNLRKHQVADAVIDEAVERLHQKQWLDDEKFAAEWVENRNTFRPRGSFALRAELRQKGLDEAVIERTLQDLDEGELARKAAQKKLRQFAALDEQTFRKKLSARLSRRGFNYGLVAEVCAEAWAALQSEQKNTNPEKGTRTETWKAVD